MNKILIFSVLLSFANQAISANDVINTTPINSVTKNSDNRTTIIDSPKNWHLTDTEWVTYQTLMQGQAGYYYPQLTPPEVLGYYANNEIERRHYAEIYVKLEHEKIERELRFNKAFHEAAVRLYAYEPIIKPFDISPYTPIPKTFYSDNNELQPGDHLVLFVDVKQSSGAILITHLITKVTSNPGVILDIYCVNATDDQVIQEWAKANQIPVDLVATNRITLNRDSSQFRKIGTSKLPTVMLVHEGKSKLLSQGDF